MRSLSWKSHPARERPVAAVVVSILILGVIYLVYSSMHNGLMVLIGILIFFLSLSTFYFPTTYTVDEKKVVIKYLYTVKERNTSAFRTVYPGRRGILLSPFLEPSRLENYRGFYLRYGKDNKDEIDRFMADLFESKGEVQAVDANTERSNGS